MNYFIQNATLVNEGKTFVASVFVSDGKIAKIVPKGEPFDIGSASVIDGTGKYLIPGIIDEHVHLHRESRCRGRWRDLFHGHAQHRATNHHSSPVGAEV